MHNLWLGLTSYIEVDPTTVATDSFMTNAHLILLRFAEPFMDAQYTKVYAVVQLRAPIIADHLP
jgi:Ubiquitin elongating factor core